jgi:8-oxo-dGTP pyrophosphatase MutT (NUDIX family)
MDRSSSTSADDTVHGPDASVLVVPRPAATVILVRDGLARDEPAGGLEVFMVRRDPRARFAPDAYVFPGGTLHDDDVQVGGRPPISGLTADEAHHRLTHRGGDPPTTSEASLALHLAAVRELFEEAGILLARHAERPTGPLDAGVCARLGALRPEVQAGRSLVQAARELGLELQPEALVYFSHWITPEVSPRRYDTRFFLAVDRSEQPASHCGLETVDGGWFAPAELLRQASLGERNLVSVTAEHLRVLARFGAVRDLLRFGCAKPIRTVLSRRGPSGWDLQLNGAPW